MTQSLVTLSCSRCHKCHWLARTDGKSTLLKCLNCGGEHFEKVTILWPTLKPCPFCGSESIKKIGAGDGLCYSYVECSQCGASTDGYIGIENAVAGWNRRAGG